MFVFVVLLLEDRPAEELLIEIDVTELLEPVKPEVLDNRPLDEVVLA